MVNGEHVDRERAFHRGVLVKIVDDNLRIRIAFELDDDAPVFIRLIPDCSDITADLLIHQIGDSLDESGAIDVEWDFGDDDLFLAAFNFFHAGFAAHFHTAATVL